MRVKQVVSVAVAEIPGLEVHPAASFTNSAKFFGPIGRYLSANSSDPLSQFHPPTVHPQPHPTHRSYVSGNVKLGWLGRIQRLVVPRPNFAGQPDDSIAVMIVQEIGERLFSNDESRVPPESVSRRLGKRQTNLRQPCQPAVLSRVRRHRVLVRSRPAK